MRQIDKKNSPAKGRIVIFKPKSGKSQLRVKLDRGTLWLSQKQMSELFKTERSVITKHINNVFKTAELNRNSVCAKFAHTAKDGKIYEIGFYNLDMIISVGYRVNSKQGTQFRIWATKVLRDYIVKGYATNQRRLREQRRVRLGELQKTVALLQGVVEKKTMEQDEAQGLLRVITEYANSWIILEKYDKKSLKVCGSKRKAEVFEYEEAKEIIKELKKKLLKKKEAGRYFGVEKEQGLAAILGNISQSIAGKPLYDSIEEKAAHLLYFVIKDHVFIDGNKRIASLLFILFLAKNDCLRRKTGERRINDSALTALALLVAESNIQEKDTMVALITNLIV